MKISVIGCGYVGLTTAVSIARLGHDVTASDSDERKLEILRKGEAPFVEESLEEYLNLGLSRKNLRFVRDNRDAVQDSDVVFICLPTVQLSDGSADVSIVFGVLNEIRRDLRTGTILVMKSTVPVGTSIEATSLLKRDDIAYVSNPEFLREGTAIWDFFNQDRIVLGSNSPDAIESLKTLFSSTTACFVVSDPTSAEMIKYVSNSFLATKLSFANSIADLCEQVGASTRDVLIGMGLDKRIGTEFLKPGPGWGGSCFPKDTAALVHTAREHSVELGLVREAIESNSRRILRIARRIEKISKASDHAAIVAILGLTFKAGTDDLRESPSIKIIQHLLMSNVEVRAFDPAVRCNNKNLLPVGLKGFDSAEDATIGANLVVILTEWPLFADLEPTVVGRTMSHRRVFDTRGLLDSDAWRSAGFEFYGFGQ